MTDLDLPALKKLCEAATEGPWKHDMGNHQIEVERDRQPICDACTSWDVGMLVGSPRRTHDDMEFIAAARTAIPQLIEEVERLKSPRERREVEMVKENQALRDELEKLRVQHGLAMIESTKLKAHFDACYADKIVELRQELGKNDLAQLATMCNEIVKLRELLGEIRPDHNWDTCRCSDADTMHQCDACKLQERIDAVLKKL